ncbi:MAG: hypothetical protein M3R59_03450 [Verrucomicrobiota bacterium]|nr:hypothetical protein [Verrucomicrobiota bacterium]
MPRLLLLALVLALSASAAFAQGLAPSKLHFKYRDEKGKPQSAPVITKYYPGKISGPIAQVDRRINPRLLKAATIAEERAHAHSRSMCWHAVKEALLASGIINTRPKTEYAKEAAQELVRDYGFKKIAVRDPFSAPLGSVLVYGSRGVAGHIEIRTRRGFVSDFLSKTPSRRPLIGVFVKS